jgi:hypothetical protein
MKKVLLSGAVVAAFALGPIVGPANANVLFSDFGPGDTVGNNGRAIGNLTGPGDGNDPAYTFVAASSGAVSQIDLAVNINSGSYVASLWTAAIGCATGVYATNCGGLVPTTELASWPVTSTVANIASITGITGVALTAGTTYFMQMSTASNATEGGWADNPLGVTGDLYQCGGDSISNLAHCVGYLSVGTATTGAFDVLGANTPSVPEPASLTLLGVALMGLGTIYRRYKPM